MTKVRNAEKAGASVVVVVNNDYKDMIMGDDGTGSEIRIPSVLIGKSEGQKLIDFTKEGKQATVNVEFVIKRVDTQTEVEFWYSSNSLKSLDFLNEFSEKAKGLEGYMKFLPRFVNLRCPWCSDDQ